MKGTPNSSGGNTPKKSKRIFVPVALAIALGIALLSIGGYLLWKRFADLERTVTRFGGQLDRAVSKVEEASGKSDTALSRALQAEEYARQAAQGRAQAEQSQAQAQLEAQQARRETDRAQDQARLAREEAERIRKERQADWDRLQTALSRIAETRRTAMGLVLNLGSEAVQFDFDKARLRPENRELLSRIAGILLTSREYRIQVFGHTDDVGSEEYNLELSRRRAAAVRDYLVEAGIAPEIISSQGFGKTSPLVPGTTADARARNRRVEVGIIDSAIDYVGAVAERAE